MKEPLSLVNRAAPNAATETRLDYREDAKGQRTQSIQLICFVFFAASRLRGKERIGRQFSVHGRIVGDELGIDAGEARASTGETHDAGPEFFVAAEDFIPTGGRGGPTA